MNETPMAGAYRPAPRGSYPVVAAYMRDVDRTLLRENLKLTPEQRVRRLVAFLRFAGELRRAGRGVP